MEFHPRLDRYRGLQPVTDPVAQRVEQPGIVGEDSGADLDPDGEPVEGAVLLEEDEIVVAHLWHRHDHLLDLGGEDVYAVDDECKLHAVDK